MSRAEPQLLTALRNAGLDQLQSASYPAGMGEFTDYQRKVIERYYDRRGQILLTRLGEIASELYLAESESRRTQLWRRAEKAMQGLKVPAAVVTHIVTERRPELLASHLRRLLDEASRLRR